MSFAEYVEKFINRPLIDMEKEALNKIENASGKIEDLGENEAKFGYAIISLYNEWRNENAN